MKSAAKFDLVFRLARGTGTLSKEEAADALQHPPLAAWVSARADVLQQLLDWALDDRTFATGTLSRAVQSLRQKPDTLAKLTGRRRRRPGRRRPQPHRQRVRSDPADGRPGEGERRVGRAAHPFRRPGRPVVGDAVVPAAAVRAV
jgi:hypothetical protein